MADVFREIITDPAAWTVDTIGGKDGLTRRLSGAELAALDSLLDRTRRLNTTEITRADFDHPAINELMRDAHDRVLHGPGAVILSGFDSNARGLDIFERIYWGLGTHLGIGAVQSGKGDLIGHVRVTASETPRGYLSSVELRPHTDFHQILSLAGVQKAERGGVSGLVSALSIHNAMLRERPDLLDPLYDGFWYALPEGVPSASPISDTKVPVFSMSRGKVSCMNNRFFMVTAAHRLGREIPAELDEALACFQRLSVRPDLYLEFELEPGEMLFWQNFVLLHARSEFHDSAEHKRHLLRLWLDVPDGRPVVPAIAERARQVDHRPALAG